MNLFLLRLDQLSFVWDIPYVFSSKEKRSILNFRDIMSLVPTSVSVVSCVSNKRIYSCTISSLVSVNIEEDNPEIVFVLKKNSYIGKLISKESFFTVSVLSIDQPSFARKYGSNREPDLISDNNWGVSNQFSHLNGARIFLDCKLVKIYDSHQADIYVGSVAEYAASKNQKSLIYDERTYGKFESI